MAAEKPDSPCTAMAALAAFRTGRPVKLVYGREETMQVSVKRHACVIGCTHAAGPGGKHIHHGSGPY